MRGDYARVLRIPPTVPVPVVGVPLPCRFCSDEVTREPTAEAAAVEAVAAAVCLLASALDLPAARRVSNWVNAELRLVCTSVDGVEEPSRLLSTWLFVDCCTNVVNADTVDATDVAVTWVGAFVLVAADTWVGALVAAGTEDSVGAFVFAA